jgi:hypothetical protein
MIHAMLHLTLRYCDGDVEEMLGGMQRLDSELAEQQAQDAEQRENSERPTSWAPDPSPPAGSP